MAETYLGLIRNTLNQVFKTPVTESYYAANFWMSLSSTEVWYLAIHWIYLCLNRDVSKH